MALQTDRQTEEQTYRGTDRQTDRHGQDTFMRDSMHQYICTT